MKYYTPLILLLCGFVFQACSPVPRTTGKPIPQVRQAFPGYESLSADDRLRADSLLAHALDHEALYSLMADLKPMSSIGFALSFPLAKDSSQYDGQAQVVDVEIDSIAQNLEVLASWNRVISALSFGPYRFVIVPFRQVWNGKRNLQILVCRTDLIDSLLIAQAPFFAQWGFVPGIDPAVLLTAIEFESKHDRFRAYGNLFGYPPHAVDFFVEASLTETQSGEFVKRDFFSIPVHQRETGYFTYAVPKAYEPGSTDLQLKERAAAVLAEYRALRPNYLNNEGNLQGVALFRDWYANKRKE